MAKVLELQLHHQSFQWIFTLISFSIDWFDLFAVQGIFKSFLQHHNLKASILWYSTLLLVQFSQAYMVTGLLYYWFIVTFLIYIWTYLFIFKAIILSFFSLSLISLKILTKKKENLNQCFEFISLSMYEFGFNLLFLAFIVLLYVFVLFWKILSHFLFEYCLSLFFSSRALIKCQFYVLNFPTSFTSLLICTLSMSIKILRCFFSCSLAMFNMFINLTSIYTFLIPRDSALLLNQCTCLVLYLDSDCLTLFVLVLLLW